MNSITHDQTDQADKPLTRSDVERLLEEAGSSERLSLAYADLQLADLSDLILVRTNLRGADLRGANLSRADLSEASLGGANLSKADLSGAILSKADLSGANLSGASLDRANLSGTDLGGATLIGADLGGADLGGADLIGATLIGASLIGTNLGGATLTVANLDGATFIGANLDGANLGGAKLRGTNLSGADLSGANFVDATLIGVTHRGTIGFVSDIETGKSEDHTVALPIRIVDEPLLAHTFTTLLSALTELHTKAWLIQQRRFSDLINYAQTHDSRFTAEAHLTLGRLAHNSPTLVELILNPTTIAAGAGAIATIASALKIAIDAVGQTRLRFKEKELELETKRQKVQQDQRTARQKEHQEEQQSHIEIEKQKLEVEKQRLEVEKQRIEIAFETATRMVDALHPGINEETKGMLIQALLPNLLQLSMAQGLELALPSSKRSGETTGTTEA